MSERTCCIEGCTKIGKSGRAPHKYCKIRDHCETGMRLGHVTKDTVYLRKEAKKARIEAGSVPMAMAEEMEGMELPVLKAKKMPTVGTIRSIEAIYNVR